MLIELITMLNSLTITFRFLIQIDLPLEPRGLQSTKGRRAVNVGHPPLKKLLWNAKNRRFHLESIVHFRQGPIILQCADLEVVAEAETVVWDLVVDGMIIRISSTLRKNLREMRLQIVKSVNLQAERFHFNPHTLGTQIMEQADSISVEMKLVE